MLLRKTVAGTHRPRSGGRQRDDSSRRWQPERHQPKQCGVQRQLLVFVPQYGQPEQRVEHQLQFRQCQQEQQPLQRAIRPLSPRIMEMSVISEPVRARVWALALRWLCGLLSRPVGCDRRQAPFGARPQRPAAGEAPVRCGFHRSAF